MIMNIIPSKTSCLRCLIPNPPPGVLSTCETASIMNTIVMIVSSIQVTEALKLLMGFEVVKDELVYVDVWNLRIIKLKVRRREGCPVCFKGKYGYLEGKKVRAQALCSRGTVQISPSKDLKLNLQEFASRLSRIGRVSYNGYVLLFDDDRYQFIIFPDGRAIVKGTRDIGIAKSVYARYIGSQVVEFIIVLCKKIRWAGL